MAGVPTTRYVQADGSYIAYQVMGEGPPDLLFMPHWFGNVEALWDLPPLARFANHLAEIGRLIMLDKRGTGLSDEVPEDGGPFLESFADDVLAVLDAAESERVALIAGDTAGLVAIMFAASYPDRVSSMVLINSFPGLVPRDEYPHGLPAGELEQHRADIFRIWLDGDLSRAAPSLGPGAAAQIVRYLRMSAGPGAAYKTRCQVLDIDVRDLLPAIRVPTLVLHRIDNEYFGIDHGRYLADHIAGARFVALDGIDHTMYTGDADAVLREVEQFVTGERRILGAERLLTTILFTDIAESTSRATQAGDRKWRETLDTYDKEVIRCLDRFRGTLVKSTGDGTLAIFDGPGRAVQCAGALRDAAQLLGLNLRSGLHTGEIEMRGVDVAGLAVHIANRVQAQALPGEVLVSRTVTDLVAGSGLEFVDRGEHQLKGVPGQWRLFAVLG